MEIILFAFLLFGILLGLMPCSIPIILIVNNLCGEEHQRRSVKSLLTLFGFIVGVIFVYFLIGLIVALLDYYLERYLQFNWIEPILGILIGFLSFSTLGFINVPFFQYRWIDFIKTNKKESDNFPIIATLKIGVLSLLITAPSTAAPLIGICSYIFKFDSILFEVSALFAIGLGFCLPLICVHLFGSRLFQFGGPWQDKITDILGLILLGTAISMFTSFLSAKIIMLLWSALAIFSSIHMNLFYNRGENLLINTIKDESICNFDGESTSSNIATRKHARTLAKMISLIILLYGFLLFIGAFIGSSNPLTPLKPVSPIITSLS